MIYAVNLMITDTGTSILKVDCLGLFGDNIDLVSGFLTAMISFAIEIFKTDGIRSIDVGGGLVIRIVDKGEYRVAFVTDDEEEENIRVKPMSILEIKILDAISDFATHDIDPSILRPIRNRINEFLFAFNRSNFATRIRLLGTRIKIGNLLKEDISKYETMLEEVSSLMEQKKNKADKWLKRIKNWIYEEYIGSRSIKEMDWGMLYKYLDKFSEKLKSITKSEIALKYVGMAETILHSGGNLDDIEKIAQDIIKMDDIIDTYIRF